MGLILCNMAAGEAGIRGLRQSYVGQGRLATDVERLSRAEMKQTRPKPGLWILRAYLFSSASMASRCRALAAASWGAAFSARSSLSAAAEASPLRSAR